MQQLRGSSAGEEDGGENSGGVHPQQSCRQTGRACAHTGVSMRAACVERRSHIIPTLNKIKRLHDINSYHFFEFSKISLNFVEQPDALFCSRGA